MTTTKAIKSPFWSNKYKGFDWNFWGYVIIGDIEMEKKESVQKERD